NVVDFIKREIEKKAVESLNDWLSRNTESAREKQNAYKPVLTEIYKLRTNLVNELNLKDLIVDHDWSLSYLKGSLMSFKTLAEQHREQMEILKHRIVVIGKSTGVSCDGRIVFSIEDVRQNWLNLITLIPKYDKMLSLVPLLVSELSSILNDIQIVRHVSGSPVLVETYLKQLSRLIRTIQDYKTIHGFPIDFPTNLKAFKLVVDNDQGPLMLLPSGQFIVPSSCYAKALIDFLIDNVKAAEKLLKNYESTVSEETVVVSHTVYELELNSLDKDDNVAPDLMISCCQKLMDNKERLTPLFSELQLRITHYYSVLQDGRICIPWNWSL
ncbi:T-cell activation inhibitor-like protein, partial [Leptotrombidium deliense]